MWHSNASSDWLCWAAADSPAPPVVVMVSGIVAVPPNMYFSLAAWFTIWSIATRMKSMNIRSTIGRRPVTAAPMPSPTMACSAIGVSKQRSTPNFFCRPL